jgi:hypothetical protein
MANDTTMLETMKSQKFGVEIETVGLDRAQLAAVVQSVVGGTIRVIGGHYNEHVVVTPDGREWKVVTDGSLSTSLSGEVVTPILGWSDVETLQSVVRALRTAGARVDSSCGLHVHVGASNLGPKGLGRLVKIVARREQLFLKAFGVSERRLSSYTRPIDPTLVDGVCRARNLTEGQLSRLWYGRDQSQYGRPSHYDSSRYHGLNLHAFWYHGTVEFRYFNGTLHAGEIRAYLTFCLALVAYAQTATAPRARGFVYDASSARRDMRYFVFLQLGLQGEEFKSVRHHLTKNLTGTRSRPRPARPAPEGGNGGTEGSTRMEAV